MSPVNDAYHKAGLLPAQHRIAMCQLAAAESDLVMVDTWEAAQADAQRSLVVLEHVQQAVQDHYRNAEVEDGHQQLEQQNSNSDISSAAKNKRNDAEMSASTHGGAQTSSQQQSGTQVSRCSALPLCAGMKSMHCEQVLFNRGLALMRLMPRYCKIMQCRHTNNTSVYSPGQNNACMRSRCPGVLHQARGLG